MGLDQNEAIKGHSLGVKDHCYQSRQPKERRAIRKLITENWRKLSGYDWELIKQFREAYQLQA